MIAKQISEFSYGYAVTSELINKNSSCGAAPFFPSLRFEGGAGGGFDVVIEYLHATPIFVQFKLSEKLKRSNASEYHLFNSGYFRFPIWSSKDSNQHKLLLELAKTYSRVYYVAPRFHSIDELNNHFLNRRVIENSIFVRPAEIGEIKDTNDHVFAFHTDPAKGRYFCSEPWPIEEVNVWHDIESGLKEPQITFSFIRELTFEMLAILKSTGHSFASKEISAKLENNEQTESLITSTASFVARNFFNCELAFVFKKPDNRFQSHYGVRTK
jgi:hypothetical protein